MLDQGLVNMNNPITLNLVARSISSNIISSPGELRTINYSLEISVLIN